MTPEELAARAADSAAIAAKAGQAAAAAIRAKKLTVNVRNVIRVREMERKEHP